MERTKRGGSYLPAGLRGAARRALLAPAEDNFRARAREEREDGEGSGCGRAGRASSRLQKAGRRDARRRQRADGPVAAERRTEATRTGWRVTEDESGGRDGPVGGAVATRVSDERSEELAGQDRSSRFPVSRDRPREATPSDARKRRERAGLG